MYQARPYLTSIRAGKPTLPTLTPTRLSLADLSESPKHLFLPRSSLLSSPQTLFIVASCDRIPPRGSLLPRIALTSCLASRACIVSASAALLHHDRRHSASVSSRRIYSTAAAAAARAGCSITVQASSWTVDLLCHRERRSRFYDTFPESHCLAIHAQQS